MTASMATSIPLIWFGSSPGGPSVSAKSTFPFDSIALRQFCKSVHSVFVEAIEQVGPVIVWRKELREGSGAAGPEARMVRRAPERSAVSPLGVWQSIPEGPCRHARVVLQRFNLRPLLGGADAVDELAFGAPARRTSVSSVPTRSDKGR